MAALSMTPEMSSPSLMTTSFGCPVLALPHFEVSTRFMSFGRKREKSCFPVYRGLAPLDLGSGRSPAYPPWSARLENCSGVRTVSSRVRRYAPVKKSLIAPMMGPPYRGERIWSWTRMSIIASDLDSSLWGTWRFISSPSKSAL